jgi:hypothetical protein
MGLGISFSKSYIHFEDIVFRFHHWFYPENKEYRNIWRQYYCQIVHSFGGDRLLYLPDQGEVSEKYTDQFFENETSFEDTEKGLVKEYGINTMRLDEIGEDDIVWYYIDRFEDLK